MRVLITSGLSGADMGGPAQYAPNLARALKDLGHTVKTVSYGRIERILPLGVRHLHFFFKVLLRTLWAERVVALDTFSTGVPSVIAAKLLGKKTIVRVGGDFLWEAYVNRTADMVTLPIFYEKLPVLNVKEKTILHLTRFLVNNADVLAFNTKWQREIWKRVYRMSDGKAVIIRNYLPKKAEASEPTGKIFLWAGRKTRVKNLGILELASMEVKSKYPAFELKTVGNVPHQQLLDYMKDIYAVVLPSLSDVCPNFILEATSLNKPFIMTNQTGLKEIYDSGGIFVDPLDKEELVRAIEKMLTPDEYSKHIKELKEAKNNHSWAEIAQEFISI